MDLERLLAQARHLELKTRHLARSHYAGLYRSAFRGLGMEFADVREYSEGDDVRLIDWNVSARSQSLFVKRMAEERERNVLLLLDSSGSLRFGSVRRTKFDLLLELGSLLVISGFYAKDRVSLAVFGARVDLYVAAAKGWNHAARLIREMVSRRPEGFALDIEQVWSFLNSPGVPRSLVILLTDFQAPLKPSNSFSAACRKHEAVAILVSDPREWELPEVGRIRVQDPETGRTGLVDTGSAEVRDQYRRNGQRRREQVFRLLHTTGVDWVEFSTASEYESTLRRFLEMRSLRRGCRHR
jgi:uncharacterized protein (DUF58 family)